MTQMLLTGTNMPSFVVFSADHAYRWALTRRWGDGPYVTWLMLNPSIADDIRDDPTVARITRRTHTMGFAAFAVVNLFGLVSPYADALTTHPDPVGAENDRYIEHHVRGAALVVAAWGARRIAARRWAQIAPRLADVEMLALASTGSGAPQHPLFVPYAMPAAPWTTRDYYTGRAK